MLHLFGHSKISGDTGTSRRLPAGTFLLVALLALSFGNSANRGALASRLREDGTPEATHGYFRQLLRRIRLWEAAASTRVLLVTPSAVARDATTFPSDLDGLLAVEDVNTAESLAALLTLYRGDFLADADVPGAELRQWIFAQRTALRERFTRLVLDGAERVGGAMAMHALRRLAELGSDLRQRSRYAAVRGAEPAEASLRQLPLGGLPLLALFPPETGPHRFSAMQRLLATSVIEDVTSTLAREKSVAVLAPHTVSAIKPRQRDELLERFGVSYLVDTRMTPGQGDGDVRLVLGVTAYRTQRLIGSTEVTASFSAARRQGAIAAAVVARLVDIVERGEIAANHDGNDANAVLNFLVARRALRSLDLRSIRRARAALRKTLAAMPKFAPALALNAWALSQEWLLLGNSDQTLLHAAEAEARLAIAIDPYEASGHRALGKCALFLHGPEEGAARYTVAERLAPHDADLLADFADTLVHNADLDGARQRLDLARALNPIAPDEYIWTAGAIAFFSGHYAQAVATFREMTDCEPAARLLAAAAAMAGERAIAAQYRDIELANRRGFTVANWLQTMPQRGAEHVRMYAHALRLAGFS